MISAPIRPVEGGVELSLRVRPRAPRSEIAGAYGDRAVKVSVAAPPVDGEANAELIGFLAERLGVPRRGVELVRGGSSRDKVVRVRGISVAEATRRLGL